MMMGILKSTGIIMMKNKVGIQQCIIFLFVFNSCMNNYFKASIINRKILVIEIISCLRIKMNFLTFFKNYVFITPYRAE